MVSLFLCAAAFALAYASGRRSLPLGVAAVLAVGFAYGILRANVLQTFSHFIFDSAALGLYLAVLARPWTPEERQRLQGLQTWLLVLVGWTFILFLLPLQDLMVQFVGLRGNVFFLPFLLIGALLHGEELFEVALWLAGLCLVAFAFAGAEFVFGIEPFYPLSPVTEIVYRSNDVAGFRAHRIPATFPNAHAYAGTMVMSLPLLIAAWNQPRARTWQRYLLVAGILVAILGVFMAAARSHAVVLFVLLAMASLSGQLRRSARYGWVVLLVLVVWLVSGQERLQRFRSLADTEKVALRVSGSVNMNFLELAGRYPIGNGLGGGGTSVPYFLQHRLRNPIAMESEYSRIVLELGLPGLALWLGFLFWIFTRSAPPGPDSWRLYRRMAWVALLFYFGIGLIGIGLLTSVPQSALLLMAAGWISVRQPAPTADVPERADGPLGGRLLPEGSR